MTARQEYPAALLAEPQRRRLWLTRLALVFLACALLLEALVGDHGLLQTRKVSEDLDRARQSVNALKRENAALGAEVHRLQQDPATLEAVARKDLGLIRPGELLVMLEDVQ